jgi:hypothetical protein
MNIIFFSCCNCFHIKNEEHLFLFVVTPYRAMTAESFFFSYVVFKGTKVPLLVLDLFALFVVLMLMFC